MINFFDIETLPTIDPSVIAALEETIKAPGNIKKPESIQLWMDENKESALKDLVEKTSFNGMYGSIACIAWANYDDEIESTDADQSEGDAIEYFYSKIYDNVTSFCGHNLAGFDIPFLKHRSIILGIRPPRSMMFAMTAKPWSEYIRDTMLMWSSDRERRVSMDALCQALGIDGKDGFDGSMVANEWFNGSKQKVIDYCKDDVMRTRKIYKRLTFNQEI